MRAGPALCRRAPRFRRWLRQSRRHARPCDAPFRTALVVGEIALTVVLLAGTGLLLRSYQAVLAVDPGFDADRLLLVETALTPSQYANAADRDAIYRRVLERVAALPGVESAGYTGYAPLMYEGGRGWCSSKGAETRRVGGHP